MWKTRSAGLAWLADLAGAALFAWGIAEAIAALADGGAVPGSAYAALLVGGMVRAATLIGVQTLAIAGAQQASRALRHRLFRRLLGEPMAMPVSLGHGAVLAIDHVSTIENFEARFTPVRTAAAAGPLMVVALVAIASWVCALILLATLVPFVIGMILAGTLARRASERQLTALSQLSELFVDRVRTLSIIRHFGAQDRIARQVHAATRDMADRTVEVLRLAFLSSAVLEFFAALSVALVAVYCGFALLGLLPFPAPEALGFREALFALAMAPEFYLPMRRLAAAYHDKQMGEAAMDAVQPVLAETPAVVAPPPGFAGLTVRALELRWPGTKIGPISFAIRRTGLLALSGPTGSGKTSVLSAIAGQLSPTAGRVTPVDPSAIAWAAQRALVLPATLRENLTIASPETDDATVLRVCAQVGLDAMLATRSEGLDLPLDHHAAGLSGGERRRLGLARAILCERPLLLCDEPTADLDDASAAAIVALLARLSQSHAVIVATHDARLIAAANTVVTL